ncbi:MAG: isoprenyl transferase [Candidatus Omnitrophica bacterium]|nr:isoprenyl transferase [Candidatus Omnitrophota bacterium]
MVMLNKENIPKHVAIIMDGNGRWARNKGFPRTAGHREGIKRVKEIIKAAGELGVKVVTFFAFSAENWSRPKKEVDALMRYLDNFLDKEIAGLDKNNIRFMVIGRQDPIPAGLLQKIKNAELKTKNNSGLTIVLALNYGARQEISDAAKKIAQAVIEGRLKVSDVDVDLFGSYLYTKGLPDPDLLIRTSGQMRVSNFLLWQLSYAEFYFPDKFWPDFRRADFEEAISEYQKRERRFGGIDAGKKSN